MLFFLKKRRNRQSCRAIGNSFRLYRFNCYSFGDNFKFFAYYFKFADKNKEVKNFKEKEEDENRIKEKPLEIEIKESTAIAGDSKKEKRGKKLKKKKIW